MDIDTFTPTRISSRTSHLSSRYRKAKGSVAEVGPLFKGHPLKFSFRDDG